MAINPDILARYAANRLRVVRQVRYSQHNENCIDLVLFLNGVPVATAELKTDFTQSIDDAIDQYRFDRYPRPKGQAAEPLLSFPSGALVHFAVSNSEVHMTTQLDGPATRFLPFNQGDHGATGNPVNPQRPPHGVPVGAGLGSARAGWRSSAATWSRSATRRSRSTQIIFPRYPPARRDAEAAGGGARRGAGRQVSRSSTRPARARPTRSRGRRTSWPTCTTRKHKKLFDSVLVVSDRNVIDAQLQEALFDFQRTTGVVATIKSEDGSKSGELAEALSGDKKIVVCTIQTFPFALEGRARAGGDARASGSR